MSNKVIVSRGFPVLSILGIIFIVLKLIDKIDWSWWWVLAPFWIPFAIFVAIFMFIGIIVTSG